MGHRAGPPRRGRPNEATVDRVVVWLKRLAVALGIVFVVAFGIAIARARASLRAQADAERRLQAQLDDVETVRTAHYVLHIPKRLREAYAELPRRAEWAYLRAATLLGGERDAEPIDVRFQPIDRSGLGGHALDRNVLLAVGPIDQVEDVLAHETAHVLTNALARGAAQRRRPESRLFDEGLGRYVELQRTRTATPSDELLLARYATTSTVTLDALLEGRGALESFGSKAIYPLGRVFVASLVEVHGKAGPAAIAHAMAEVPPDAPLIRGAFRGARLDLDAVARRFDARLEAVVTQRAAELARFPRLHVTATRAGAKVILRHDAPGPLEGFGLAAFVDRERRVLVGGPSLEYVQSWTYETRASTLDVQLCWFDDALDLCEPWVTVEVR